MKIIATALAVAEAIAILAASADAAAKKKPVVTATGQTAFVSRDERGRTRIIIQKRSYLDPGTESFASENTGRCFEPFRRLIRPRACRQHRFRQQPDGAAGSLHSAEQE